MSRELTKEGDPTTRDGVEDELDARLRGYAERAFTPHERSMVCAIRNLLLECRAQIKPAPKSDHYRTVRGMVLGILRGETPR